MRSPEQQVKEDGRLAAALQAHYYHRADHPSQHGGGGRSGGGGHGSGGQSGGGRAAAIEGDMRMALEANPEAFVPVPMLYVSCTLNEVPLKAFVDTGAQMTVMSVRCAEKCALLQKVDPRFRGVAAGVGVARLAGRVHLATLRFGPQTAVDLSITVMEQNSGPDLLLGLDVMRKYAAVIDLGRNALVIGGKLIPFVEGDERRRR